VYAHPLPSEDVVRLYESLVDPDYQAGRENRRLQMAKILNRGLRSFGRPGSLLDIGAGTGLLVHEASVLGWDAIGVEPSRWCVETAKRENGIDLRQGTFPHPELIGRKFDSITLIDVIEHVTDPLDLLRSVRSQLNDDGVLIVSTPDVDSVCARLAGRRWWHYRAAHLCFFNSGSMEVALSSAGLRLREKFRQTWWFPVHYLIQRMGRNVPVGWVDRAMSSGGRLARLGRIVVPVNPFDSWVYVTEPVETV
jgi:SAM-dependent methyltransferase